VAIDLTVVKLRWVGVGVCGGAEGLVPEGSGSL